MAKLTTVKVSKFRSRWWAWNSSVYMKPFQSILLK